MTSACFFTRPLGVSPFRYNLEVQPGILVYNQLWGSPSSMFFIYYKVLLLNFQVLSILGTLSLTTLRKQSWDFPVPLFSAVEVVECPQAKKKKKLKLQIHNSNPFQLPFFKIILSSSFCLLLDAFQFLEILSFLNRFYHYYLWEGSGDHFTLPSLLETPSVGWILKY